MNRLFAGRDADMTGGSIPRLLTAFAIPMALGLLLQQLYNTVDALVVGQYVSSQALAAVGTTGSICNMLVGFCAGLSTGAGVVIARAYGAHDAPRLRDAVHTSILVAVLLSVLMTLLGLLIVDPMLRLMNTPEDVYSDARTYLVIYFGGISGLVMYNMGSAVMRAVGDSTRPLLVLFVSAVVNIVSDLLCVIEFRMGVAGAAWATVLSQLASCVLVLTFLTKEKGDYGIRWRKLHLVPGILRDIFIIGLPSGIQQGITSFSNVFVQSYTNYFGSAAMAGWASYNKLDAYIFVPSQSISMGASTFVAQNAGAGLYSRAREGVRVSLYMSLGITAVLCLACVVWARQAIAVFSPDPEVIRFGVFFVTLISPFYIFTCFTQTYAGALRGVGNATAPMYIMLFSYVLFRQAYLFTAKQLGNSLTTISLAYPVGWMMCTALQAVAYRRSILCRREEKNIGKV